MLAVNLRASSALSAIPTNATKVSAATFLNSTASSSTLNVKASLLQIFGSEEKLRQGFVSAYNAAMADPANKDISPENGEHLALVQTIMDNRSAFPAGGFKIKTELPGGGSIETEIPPASGQPLGAPTDASATGDLNSLSTIIKSIILDMNKPIHTASDGEANSERLAKLYR